MKYIFSCLSILTLLFVLAACHSKDDNTPEGKIYAVAATVQVDSTIVMDHLVLFTDNHVNLSTDSLILSPQHKFEHEGRTAGLDELYLCSDHGELCRFYASGGMEIAFELKNAGDTVTATFAETSSDTINAWLQTQEQSLAGKTAADCRTAIDTLCHQTPYDVRNTLLLREEIWTLKDSLFVRRCLGALTDEAKPNWLVKSIEQILDNASDYKVRNHHLSNCTFSTDSADFDMSTSRSEYLLLYYWANYSAASRDSLRMINRLVGTDYDMKRLQFISFCLDATDSLAWKNQIRGMNGRHVWIKAGLSDKRLYNWHVEQVPCLIICDMYNNQQQRNVWGKELRDALERVPNKSGFAHTPR